MRAERSSSRRSTRSTVFRAYSWAYSGIYYPCSRALQRDGADLEFRKAPDLDDLARFKPQPLSTVNPLAKLQSSLLMSFFSRQNHDFAYFHLKMKRCINIRNLNESHEYLLSCKTDAVGVTWWHATHPYCSLVQHHFEQVLYLLNPL